MGVSAILREINMVFDLRARVKTMKIGGRIKIALVGCGRISRNHIKAIAQHEDKAELVAICDNDEKDWTHL